MREHSAAKCQYHMEAWARKAMIGLVARDLCSKNTLLEEERIVMTSRRKEETKAIE